MPSVTQDCFDFNSAQYLRRRNAPRPELTPAVTRRATSQIRSGA